MKQGRSPIARRSPDRVPRYGIAGGRSRPERAASRAMARSANPTAKRFDRAARQAIGRFAGDCKIEGRTRAEASRIVRACQKFRV
jgi:hypothetical protein